MVSCLLTLNCLFSHHLFLLARQLLLGQLLLSGRVVGRCGAGHGVLALTEADLDVAGRRHVWVDTTVGTVRTSTKAGGAVYLK